MSVNPTQVPLAYGWQTKQFAIDPNDPGRGTLVNCWAFPSTTAVSAAVVTPVTEYAANPTGGGYTQ